MNVGNQPTPGGVPPPSTTDIKRSQDVDPTKLLNMLPDLAKLARKKDIATKDEVKTQDKVVTDSQIKALKDFAKLNLAQPQLQPGTKAALDNWVSAILKQEADQVKAQETGADGTKAAKDPVAQTPTQQKATNTTTTIDANVAQDTTTSAQTAKPAAAAGQLAADGQATTTQTTAGQPTQTPQDAQAGAPAMRSATLPDAQPQAGAAQTAPQGGTTTTQADQTQDAAPTTFGGDPAELLTDGPDVKSGPLKTLGKLASETAAAQGGKLTPEQVALFKSAADDLFSSGASSLTDTDKAVLMSFIAQLEEFPTADDPDAPDAKASTQAPAKADDGSQSTSQTKSTKAPDTSKLAMDELGLSDAVQELGQQALNLVQGNNGKISEKDAEQLKMAAEELIAAGADGDDLKALQNFIKALVDFPKMMRSAAAAGGPLQLAEQGIDPQLAKLGEFATAMLRGQNGTLTEAEVASLKNMAQGMMSELSPEDQAVLKTWLTTLNTIKVETPPPPKIFIDAMLFSATTPKTNPYMSPGIMAMLAPILAEITQLNNDIIRQSSKLKQGMMKLLTAMANEVFKFAIAAGEAKAAQMRMEAMKNITLGVSQVLQAGMALGMHAVSTKQSKGQKETFKQGQIEKKLQNWAKGDDIPATDPNKGKMIARREEVIKSGAPPSQIVDGITSGSTNGPQGFGGKQLSKKDFNQTHAEKTEMMSYSAQQMTHSGAATAKTMAGHFGTAIDSFIKAGFDLANIKNVMDEAVANAHKDMISTLTQLVMQTMQTASDEMQTSQKNFDSFIQLYKDFANTITQGIYRSG